MADAYPYQPIIRLPKSKASSSSARSNSTQQQQQQPVQTPQDLSEGIEALDTVVTDTLYFDGLTGNVTETELRNLLHRCQPLEVVINRDEGNGHLRFKDAKLADRVFSLYNGFTFPDDSGQLQFRVYHEGTNIENEPKGPILQVKNLPLRIDNNGLYDLFRPFGPLSLCKPIVEGTTFRGTAFVQYFYQGDSDEAQKQLNDKVYEGNALNVVSFMPSKTRPAPLADPVSNTHGPGPAMPAMMPNEKADAGFVDYMNLYIKNLDSSVTNNDLFNMFRKFGRIVSARVMSNPTTGQSKGYGFVSYDKAEEAAAALQEMNGKLVASKQLIVAYHEPKKPRHDKGSNNGSNSNSNNGSSHHQQQSNHQHAHQQQQGLPAQQGQHHPSNNHVGNGASPFGLGAPVGNSPAAAASMAAAAAAAGSVTNVSSGMGTPYMPLDTRHPYDVNMAPPISVPSPVSGLGIDNVDQIAMNIKSIGQKRPPPPHPIHRKLSTADSNFGQAPLRLSPPFSTSPMSGISSTGPSLASLASGLNVQARPLHHQPLPHHQQQQHQQHQPHSQPDYPRTGSNNNNSNNNRPTLRRKGSLESISSVMTESSATVQRQRLTEAVQRCGDYGKSVNDIVDMLLTLKRKERSLCLFNHDFLRGKIQDAVDALETFNEDSEDEYEANGVNMPEMSTPLPVTTVAPVMQMPQPPSQQQHPISVPPPRISKAIPIVAPPPDSPTKTASPKPKASPTSSTPKDSKTQEVENLLASLEGKPTHEKKQQLGDRLFPLVKATGTKHAPKVTIRLLDTIDLHELARFMHDKNRLKEQVDIAFASLK